MSAQFGKWNLDGKPGNLQDSDPVRPVLAQYGPDAEGIFRRENVEIIYRAFHTTKESRLESQPHVSASGVVITWDGRLDNRSDLVHELGGRLPSDSPDLLIVTAAYEEWGTDSFAKLIGDWAISVWNPRSQCLILAKDFVGTRHLYYSVDKDQVTWSTILDPLVLFSGKTFALCEEYIAGWLSFLPAPHLTPYVGIHSVPPSSFVALRPGTRTIKKYWDFDPYKRIQYRTDGEYEEHFRSTFAEAVRRRLRSDSPILAELSGGMDSSSIVCVADKIIACGMAETSRLDTVSYYDDSEPNWNERPYFVKVEEKRGRTGCHINVGSQEPLRFGHETGCFAATPASLRNPSEAARQFALCMTSQGNRVLLSGIGGDEVTGGVPTPVPELADLLARGQIKSLSRELKIWALRKKKPWFYLCFDAARGFFPPSLVAAPKYMRPAPWLNHGFVSRNRAALTGYESRLKLFGPLPSFQENLNTLNVLKRQLGCGAISYDPPCQTCYPYLDRDLLDFLYAVPREQLVRPGQRRSLMRRALVGIVPDELLDRKRKGFVVRAPLTAISSEWASVMEMMGHTVSASLGIVDAKALREAAEKAREGQEVPIVALARTLGLEIWLKGVTKHEKLKAYALRPPLDLAACAEPDALTDLRL